MFQRENKDYFSNSKFVQELTPKDFDEVKTWSLNKKECCIILFYKPWCPFCKKMKEVWEELGEKAAFFDVYSFNCEKYFTHCSKIKEDQPGLMPTFPSMIIYENGEPSEKVGVKETERTVEHFIEDCIRVCKKKLT